MHTSEHTKLILEVQIEDFDVFVLGKPVVDVDVERADVADQLLMNHFLLSGRMILCFLAYFRYSSAALEKMLVGVLAKVGRQLML